MSLNPDGHAGARRGKAGIWRPEKAREGALTIRSRHSTDAALTAEHDQGRSVGKFDAPASTTAGAMSRCVSSWRRRRGHGPRVSRGCGARCGGSYPRTPPRWNCSREPSFRRSELQKASEAARAGARDQSQCVQGLIYKGRSQTGARQERPANRRTGRQYGRWFTRANRHRRQCARALDVLLRDLRRAGR